MNGTTPSGDRPHIEIVTDEDWKTRVKAEDAKRDAEIAQAAKGSAGAAEAPREPARTPDAAVEQTPEPRHDDQAAQFPDATFYSLVQILSTQAASALGLLDGPGEEQPAQPEVARHFIDLLGMLETKCQGNLTPQESQFLTGTLHELRMACVEVLRRSQSQS